VNTSIEELVPKLVETTEEIFTSMIMMSVRQEGEIRTELDPLRDSITGMVGLAGECKGMVAIHLPRSVACAITTNFLGIEVAEITEDVQDAVGELANMLGGNIKTHLGGGKSIQLSLPSTVSGDEYAFEVPEQARRLIVPFATDGGHFFVELELEQ